MAQISTLVPLLATHTAGVVEPVLVNALRRSANRFCIDSGIWRETLESSLLQEGAYIVELDLPSQSKLVAVLDAEFNGLPLTLAGDELTLPPEPSSRPKKIYGEAGEAFLDGYVTAGDSLRVRVSLAPSYTATTIPDKILEYWQEGIIAGALAELYVYPGNAQYDPNLASYWRELFAVSIMNAKGRARSGHTHVKRTVHYGGI